MAKISDYTKEYGCRKWVEVGYFISNDEEEELKIVAKFLSVQDARRYAEMLNKSMVEIFEIVIR